MKRQRHWPVKGGRGPLGYGFTQAVRVMVASHQRPAVMPADGLQMKNPTEWLPLLKMQEPPLAVGGVHQRALVRPVHGRRSLRQYNLLLVWTFNASRPEHDLPARRHTTGGGENVV